MCGGEIPMGGLLLAQRRFILLAGGKGQIEPDLKPVALLAGVMLSRLEARGRLPQLLQRGFEPQAVVVHRVELGLRHRTRSVETGGGRRAPRRVRLRLRTRGVEPEAVRVRRVEFGLQLRTRSVEPEAIRVRRVEFACEAARRLERPNVGFALPILADSPSSSGAFRAAHSLAPSRTTALGERCVARLRSRGRPSSDTSRSALSWRN